MTVAVESGCGCCHPARAFREQLHQLPRVVLVRALTGRGGKVEVAEHRGVCGDVHEHRPEVGHAHAPPREVLPVHERVVSGLAVVAGEMPVPEQGHALGERRGRGENVADPPLLELGNSESAARRGRGGQHRRFGGLGLEQPVDGFAVSVRQGGVQLSLGVAKAGSPQQLHHACRLAAERRDPISARGGAGMGEVLDRPPQKANGAHAHAGRDGGGQGLAAGDSFADGRCCVSAWFGSPQCHGAIQTLVGSVWHHPDVKNS